MTMPGAVQKDRGEPSKIRMGIIDSTGQVVVQGTVLENAGILQGYAPVPGDTVAVVGQSAVGTSGSSWLVLGRARDFGQATVRTVRVLLTSTTIPNAAVTPIPWDRAMYDTDSFWDPAVPFELFMPFSGIFAFTVNNTWEANGTGVRYVAIEHNSNPIIHHRHPAIAGDFAELGIAAEFEVLAGDVISFDAYQTSGGDLDLSTASATARLVGSVR